MTHQVVWLCGNLCERCSSSLQPGIACLPQTRAFFDCVYLRICKTRKATCAYGHLLWIWMSVRCRFGCRSDQVWFSRKQPHAKMHRFREKGLNMFFSAIKKKMFWQSLWRVRSQPAHTSTLAPNTSTWAFCKWFPFSNLIHVIWRSFQMSFKMSFPSYIHYPQKS